MDYLGLERQLAETLKTPRRPVAVAYLTEAPAGVDQFEGSVPSGCTFWRLAGEGRSFYTVPSDHHNCPVGSYTHNVPLPQDRSGELSSTLSLMTGIGYLRMEEVPGIFRLASTPGVVVYSPLASAPCEPSVVVVAARPRGLMVLMEAAVRAGAASALPLLSRPTCMALPAAIQTGAVTSSGCAGNRVYTGLGDDELYAVIPGDRLETVAAELRTIREANEKLATYHRARQIELTA